MLMLMLVVGAVLVAALLYVVMHKRPVVNNVGLADPSTWHAQPTLPTLPPPVAVQPELMMPPSTPQAPTDTAAL